MTNKIDASFNRALIASLAPDQKKFVIGYLEAALWTGTDESDESGGEPLDSNYDIDDFAGEAIEKAVADSTKFMAENRIDLIKASKDYSQHGHDFLLTRNGHGAGFWDRGYGKVGERLTAATKRYGEQNPYLGDDKKIYFHS